MSDNIERFVNTGRLPHPDETILKIKYDIDQIKTYEAAAGIELPADPHDRRDFLESEQMATLNFNISPKVASWWRGLTSEEQKLVSSADDWSLDENNRPVKRS